MKVIIAGGRDFNDFAYLEQVCLDFEISEVVCGCAKGADTLGSLYGVKHNIPVREFPADWFKYGKKAGIMRNTTMGKYADFLIAFWDTKSKGTAHMIEYMKQLKKPFVIRNY